MPPAARVSDLVDHAAPPKLTPGPGSPDVKIGFLPAWRGMPLAAAGALQGLKAMADTTIKAAQAVTAAATGPALPAAKAAEEATKATMLASMTGAITAAAAGADIHMCTTPFPTPPHGPGVVINASTTVTINFLPAAREKDTILEAIGPPNSIKKGEPTVLIGG